MGWVKDGLLRLEGVGALSLISRGYLGDLGFTSHRDKLSLFCGLFSLLLSPSSARKLYAPVPNAQLISVLYAKYGTAFDPSSGLTCTRNADSALVISEVCLGAWGIWGGKSYRCMNLETSVDSLCVPCVWLSVPCPLPQAQLCMDAYFICIDLTSCSTVKY